MLSCVALVAGCATITANDGQRVTLEHDMGMSIESIRAVAVKACQQNGKTDAAHVNTSNKNPHFKPGFGAQLSTFECR
jgi:hypothetical protein